MYYGEKFNAWTHLAGTILAVSGSAILITMAVLGGDFWKILSFVIYGVSLVFLYSISTLYHSLRGRKKMILRELDHHSIYLLIAGTYTPFCLVTLHGPWGWSLLGTEWGLALFGILQEVRHRSGARMLSLTIYVLMGWIAILAVLPLLQGLGLAGFIWLVLGGVFYTVGIRFYILDTSVTHAHGIWHLFVIAGSIAHYIAIMRYVL